MKKEKFDIYGFPVNMKMSKKKLGKQSYNFDFFRGIFQFHVHFITLKDKLKYLTCLIWPTQSYESVYFCV